MKTLRNYLKTDGGSFGLLILLMAFLFALTMGYQDAKHTASAAAGDVTVDLHTVTSTAQMEGKNSILKIKVEMGSDYSATQGGTTVDDADIKSATGFNTIKQIYADFYGTGAYTCVPDDTLKGGADGKVFIWDTNAGTELASGDVSASPCYLSVYGHQ